jgi:hypothetical protein
MTNPNLLIFFIYRTDNGKNQANNVYYFTLLEKNQGEALYI